MNPTNPLPQPLLNSAWQAFWAGNHLLLTQALSHQSQSTASPGAQIEFWLLQAHLYSVSHQAELTQRAYRAAFALAPKEEHPLPHLIISLHALESQLLSRQLEVAGQTLAVAQQLALSLAGGREPDAQTLLGRLAFLAAIHAALTQGRAAALTWLTLADRHARILGREHTFFGIAFGPLNLKSDCTFLLLCFEDPRGALRLAKTLDPSRLTPLRQAYLLLDIALAYASLGQHESEEYYYSKAARLVPHFRSYAYA